jgi:SAM-dependent methyltransferase
LEPGFVNVDRVFPEGSIVPPRLGDPSFEWADLSEPWPWEDSTVEHIRAHDIIEHILAKIHTMNEAWRVLKPGGTFDIAVPTTDGPGAWQDPTHVSFWNRNSFMYFEHLNPHLVRFGKAYGIKCAYRIRSEKLEDVFDGVKKLSILLEAVK